MKLEDIHIGDIVRVRQWGDMAAEFGLDRDGDIRSPWGFLHNMARLCGLTFEVAELHPLGDGCTQVITAPRTWEILTTEVFEPVTEDPLDFIDLSKYLE